MDPLKDASQFYEVERRVRHAERPGFRINELQIFLRDPKHEVRLRPGDSFVVEAGRPHLVTNGGDRSATFLTLQGIGEYDFVPL